MPDKKITKYDFTDNNVGQIRQIMRVDIQDAIIRVMKRCGFDIEHHVTYGPELNHLEIEMAGWGGKVFRTKVDLEVIDHA